ncbi:hypothetical protein IAT38_001294 [Cryptococcus sp. DSM 104549]
MAEDVGELLRGITAEDLDDFEDWENDEVLEDASARLLPSLSGKSHSPPPSSVEQAFIPPTTGFATGRGQMLPPPSKAALERARRLLDEDEDGEKDEGDSFSGASKRPRLESPAPSEDRADHLLPPMASVGPLPSGFSTGRGVAVPPPSKAAQDRVAKLFEEIDASLDQPLPPATPSAPPMPSHLPSSSRPAFPSLGLQLGSGKSAPTPSSSNIAKVMSLFADTESGSPSRAPSQSPALKPFLRDQPISALPSTPTRTPLSTTTNTFSSIKKPIQIKTPASATSRRIGLGATPSQRKTKRSFVTPFKAGRAAGPIGPATPSISKPAPRVYEPVFDLTAPQERLSVKQFHLHPQYYSTWELKEFEISPDVWSLDLAAATNYQFQTPGGVFGSHQAFDLVQKDKCFHATDKWVRNHWSQIIWKIAGEIQAKPDFYRTKWCPGEVVSQLKYRYEREFGAAERPIVRRIQEHDSSPSLPMVLVISAIHQDKGEEGKPAIHLELTDGWYRIKAQIDECLSRAVVKGRIAVGRKIGVAGAKLESGSDGAEALDALQTSHLIISGNSTSLVRWHARLGLQPHPFIASLSSLSVDGGIVTLMDVVIDKIFPLAYTNGDRNAKEGPWGEEEEQTRQDAWKEKNQSERIRLEDQMRRDMEKMEDLGNLLAQYAEEASSSGGEAPDSLENDFDELLDARDASSKIRSLSSRHVIHLAQYARMRISRELEDGRADMEQELQTTCPPRDVRDFRMVRFSDAQEGYRDACRTGMLNVWDAKALGEGSLQEGGRYLVSNLMPGRSGDWHLNRARTDKAEIYLHTRRDTRWQRVDQ